MATKLTMTEAELQRAVIDAAHTFGWLVHHVKPARTPDGKYLTRIAGDPGFPDLVLARDGVVIFVELKAERGQLSTPQDQWLTELNPYGGHAFRGIAEYGGKVMVEVWRPEHWTSGEIVEILR